MSTIAHVTDLPREGHLIAVLRMLSFIKSKNNSVTVFDHAETEIDQTQFPTEDWSVAPYVTCKEDIPSEALISRGIGVTMRDALDSYHPGYSVTRRSRTSFNLFLNSDTVFFLRNRGVVKHLVLVLSLLQ